MKTVFFQILDMSVSASILAVAVILFRLLLKKAPKYIHCILWAMVALRLVCPDLPESKASLIPDNEPISSVVFVGQGHVSVPNPEQSVQRPDEQPQSPVPEKTEQETAVQWEDILPALWMTGVVAMAGYGVVSYLLLRRKVAPSVAVNGAWICDDVASPFILGIFRPRIYLPSALDDSCRESVMAHEKAHLRRKDHWWKPLGFALLTLHWFNPVMWLAYILLCRDIEAACDERVVKKMDSQARRQYSEALLACAMPRRSITACPLAFGEQGVKGRIKSVLSYKKPTVWILLAAAVISAALAAFFLTDPIAGLESLKAPTGNKKISTVELDALRNEVPEYFVAEEENVGVYVWEEDQQLWCGLMRGTDKPTQRKLDAMTAVTLDVMYSILRGTGHNVRTTQIYIVGQLETLKQQAGEDVSEDVAELWIRTKLGLANCRLYSVNDLYLQGNSYHPTGETVNEDQLGLCLAEDIGTVTCLIVLGEIRPRYTIYTVKGKDSTYLAIAEISDNMVYHLYQISVPEEDNMETEPVWDLEMTGQIGKSMPGFLAIEEDHFYFYQRNGGLYRIFWPDTKQLQEGQTIRISYRSNEKTEIEYPDGHKKGWNPGHEITAMDIEPVFMVYFVQETDPEAGMPLTLPNERYYAVFVTAEERDTLLKLKQDRAWHDSRVSSNLPRSHTVWNVVVDGAWNVYSVYDDSYIMKDHRYYSVLTQEEKDLLRALKDRAYESKDAQDYFTDDYLVYQQMTGK